MSTYFSVLPRELLLELSLYFNYRDSVLHCDVWRCDVKFWLNKIKYELGYSDEFIREYVYDISISTSKTIMPINEKYLELKARRGADFGTEFYSNLALEIVYSSRLKDTQYAIELTEYLIKMTELRFPDIGNIKNNYVVAVRGSISMGRLIFADQLIEQFYNNIDIILENVHERNIGNDFNKYIIMGIYENSNLDLFNHYGITDQDIDVINIISGLAAGGHLEQLRPYESLLNADNLLAAGQLNRRNIIQNYKWLLNDSDFLKFIIDLGNIELLPPIKDLPQNIQETILIEFISRGYLEELIQYQDLLTLIIAKRGIRECLLYNHIDVLVYIYKLFPDVSGTIRHAFKSDMKFLTLTTIDYLLANGIISMRDTKTTIIYLSDLSLMNKYNEDALHYLLNLPY